MTLVAAALPAAAQPERPELNGPTQLEMNEQAAARYRMADRELNAVYNKLLAVASPGGRERLRAAQSAWIIFRDLDCEARVGARGGSLRLTLVPLCREAVTDERTRSLKAMLDCEQGKAGCGGHLEP